MRKNIFVFGSLLMAISLSVSAAELAPYGVFAGSYTRGDIKSCIGSCDADSSKSAADVMLGVGLQYGYFAAEVNGYVDGQGFGVVLVGRAPIGERHSLGIGGGVMRLSYDFDFTSTLSSSVDGNVVVGFLEYSGRVYGNNDRELRILARAGWQDGTLVGKIDEFAGTPPLLVASHRAEIDESGPFGQLGILFRYK